MSEIVTQNTILNLLSSAMFQKPFYADSEVDWKAVFDECKAQSVISLAFSALQKEEVPQNIYAHWKALVNENLAVNSKVSYAHTMLNDLLNQASIPYVILKGCASAEYYDDPLLRTMGDVDFLVSEKEIKQVDKLLKNQGFVFNNSFHEIERAYEKEGVILELHWSITGIPGGKTGERLESFFMIFLINQS